jgi:hypothetical protein
MVMTLFVVMACSFGYEGVAIGSDPDIELLEDQTATAESAQNNPNQKAATTQEPEYQPPASPSTSAVTANSGKHDYAVAATNFNCTCQVDGDVIVEFNIQDDQLEYSMFGGAPDVYEKIGENSYKRTFMGYYILSSGSGAQATETVVEEERHSVIILNDDGYVMEHYQGADSSPCCYHTFTLGGTFGTVP